MMDEENVKKACNFFDSLTDGEILKAMDEYEKFCRTFIVDEDGILAKARAYFIKAYGKSAWVDTMVYSLQYVSMKRKLMKNNGKPGEGKRLDYMREGDVVTFKTPDEMMNLPRAVYNDVSKNPDPDFDEDYIYSEEDHWDKVYLVQTFKSLSGIPFTVKKIEGPYSWMPYREIELDGERIDELVETGCGTKYHEWWLKKIKKV